MPMFNYKCKKCEHVTSFLEKHNSRQAHECENCGSKNTEKMFSKFAVGSGNSSSSSTSCPTGTCPFS